MGCISAKLIAAFFILFLIAGNLSCKRAERVKPKSNTDSPPVITSVKILPENPTQESDLSLSIQSQNPSQNPMTYRYQWIKNDVEIIGEDKDVLKSGSFKKGDLIRVQVIPSDGKIEGKAFLSDPAKILNSQPVIQEVRIEPRTPSVRDDLKVHVKSFDLDRDFIYYTYRWERNGVPLTEERAEILARDRLKKGDSITVTVTPDDREAIGVPKKSNPVMVSNSPPVIVSSPPASAEGTSYLYQVRAIDPDNDPITFALKSRPKGMEIDKDTGLVKWNIRIEDKGTHFIEIEASDNDGGNCIQRYTLAVEARQP